MSAEQMVAAMESALKGYLDDAVGDLRAKVEYYGERLTGTPLEAAEVALRYNVKGTTTFMVMGRACHPYVFEAYMQAVEQNARLRHALVIGPTDPIPEPKA